MITFCSSQAQYLVPSNLMLLILLEVLMQEPYFWCLNDGFGITMECDSGWCGDNRGSFLGCDH